MRSSITILVLAAGLIAGSASAHGIWFGERGKKLVLAYGIGSEDLEIVSSRQKVRSLTAYDAKLRPISISLRTADPLLLVDTPQPPALLAAVMDNGTWSRLPDGEWVEKPKGAVPGSTVTETAMKYAVAIEKPLAAPVPVLPEQVLQIMPVGPLPTMRGKPMTYRILYRGKPVAGAAVVADMIGDPDAKPATSSATGLVTLPVRNQGINVLRAIHVVKPDDASRTDRIEHLATLTFTLEHAPE